MLKLQSFPPQEIFIDFDSPLIIMLYMYDSRPTAINLQSYTSIALYSNDTINIKQITYKKSYIIHQHYLSIKLFWVSTVLFAEIPDQELPNQK